MEDDCPICYEGIAGAVTQMGCCRKYMHAECYIKCMVLKTECPMCRTDQAFEIIIPVAPESEPEESPPERDKKIFIPIIFLSMSLGMLFSTNPFNVLPGSIGMLLGCVIFKE